MLTSRVQFILQQSRSARRALLANSPQVFLVGEGGVQSCPTVLGDTMIGGGGDIKQHQTRSNIKHNSLQTESPMMVIVRTNNMLASGLKTKFFNMYCTF